MGYSSLILIRRNNKIPQRCAIDTGCWRVPVEGDISCSFYQLLNTAILPDFCDLQESAHPRPEICSCVCPVKEASFTDGFAPGTSAIRD
jgi:hypothetical protein